MCYLFFIFFNNLELKEKKKKNNKSFPFTESKQKLLWELRTQFQSLTLRERERERVRVSRFERERERLSSPATVRPCSPCKPPLFCLDWIGDVCALPCLTIAPPRRVNHLAALPWLNRWWVCHEDYEDLIGKSGERKPAKSKDLIGIQSYFGFRNFALLIEFLYKLSPYVSWRCLILFLFFWAIFLFFFLCCNVFHFRKLVGWFCNAQ